VARPGGLGRGLGALIPSGELASPPASGLREVPLSAITANRRQPRQHFDEEALTALAESIRELGVLQPVLLRDLGDGSYELIAGERRVRAARRVGLQEIPAVVRESDDAAALAQAIVENVQRENLNPLEEAAAYQQLIEDFSLTHDQVAARVGKSRASVSNMLRLLQLPPSIQKAVRDKQITMGHARALLGSPDRAFQEALARRVVAEDLSVRAVEDAVREHAEGDAGDGGTAAARGSTGNRRLRPAGFVELEELLGEYLDTRVKISMGNAGKGKLTVEFGGLEDLERLYRLVTEGRAKVVAPATS
jgi:ParB family transcriptional regulator, chromosome partitioning protein